MKIEEYLVEELTGSEATDMAADGAAMELIEQLGLQGQRKLTSTTATRNPFRRMTQLESLVYGILFPNHTELTKFDAEIIPLRVLELAKRAVDCGLFVQLEVWHNTEKVDPVMVGVSGELHTYDWGGSGISDRKNFLIARWGKALQSFEQLCAAARDAWMAERKSKLVEMQNNARNGLASLESDAILAFTTGKMPSLIL